jgi:single-stranded-DNA-specific exonuclease
MKFLMNAVEALAPASEPALALAPKVSEVAGLMAELGLCRTVATWLVRRGHTEPARVRAYLEPKLRDLSDPAPMLDRERAADRLAQAVRQRESVVVFGDYDCDGMTSTAILTEALRQLGGEVKPLLASRFDGGYGLSELALKRVLAARPGLVVTCDCGSSDHAALRVLGQHGIDVVVIDHHLVPEEELPALAFLNPHRPGCGFAFKGLASCGLVLSLVGLLRSKLGQTLDLKQWLDLVAIGTIADVAPVLGDNRPLVKAGLASLARGERPGVKALLELAKLSAHDTITTEDIAFRLAPRLNAPGRMGSPDPALELLLSTTDEQARGLAARVEQLSLERRSEQERMLELALEEIEREGYASRPAIVLGQEGFNHGIVGIVSGRLAERFGRPVVVVGFEGAIGRGSVRGPQGARLHDAISRVSHLLVRFGGHQAACGLEVRWEQLGALRTGFEEACRDLLPSSAPTEKGELEATYFAEDEPEAVLRDLYRLEPFGLTNPEPSLSVQGSVLFAREVKGGHLKLELQTPNGRKLAAFAPGLGARLPERGASVRCSGRLRWDYYRGGEVAELCVTELEPHG